MNGEFVLMRLDSDFDCYDGTLLEVPGEMSTPLRYPEYNISLCGRACHRSWT